jgi:hypothetical protein
MYEKSNVASGLLPYDGSPGERFEYSLGVDVLRLDGEIQSVLERAL